MVRLLTEQFRFSSKDIITLTEGQEPRRRPTRANIVREMEALIRESHAGERVVLYFAGHGCQQPDQQPSDPNDPEPDGLDELFLPADVGPWNAVVKSVRNAIVDDEFRSWSGEILNNGAELLVIFDTCHSGSGMRAMGDEIVRRVEPEELIPRDVLVAATGERRPPADSASMSIPLGWSVCSRGAIWKEIVTSFRRALSRASK